MSGNMTYFYHFAKLHFNEIMLKICILSITANEKRNVT